ncbi:acetyl-CoA synthetase-like protein [Pholiota conissans]|uniref:Acetyl-CoA synthetase-like protein n=1 Tax=Pholiota conissans TaxID=109636 RepID=A0A9P5YUV3_9AGAR|nr:acetyl-CoA synthetase-like protein [Pholiota conissans]
MSWKPARTLPETEALLTAPGSIHELETALVDGRMYRVYKNLWPSLREFWLSAVSQYSTDTYIVFEDQRLTYSQVHTRAIKVAGLLRNIYNIKKGDRVSICSRNSPEYLVIFWACHLIGAVAVLANAWLPLTPLSHCLALTGCKMVVVDPERADLLQASVSQLLRDTEINTILVMDVPKNQAKQWEGIHNYQDRLDQYHSNGLDVITSPISIHPEDDATIIFTSGTTGLPKGVLSTQRQFLTNVLNLLSGGLRAALRRGDDYPTMQKTCPQKGALIAVPLFHVTGCTSFSMMATLTGMKIVMAKKWEVEEAVRLIKRENVTVAGGVPSMVTDLTLSSLVGHPLEGLIFGGAPAPDTLVPRARKAFPTATMNQAYGLTETNSIAVSFAGDDYTARPSSTGLPSPINDIRIVHEGVCVPPRTVGEVWLRGPNIMKCYWGDPKATEEIITKDGWLRTGDLGYVDEEGFLYIKDRLKDVIIRGGENIDSVTVENALYADPRILEAAAVGVPDERLGELVAVIVSVRSEYEGQVTESTLIEQARNRLPKFAVPVMIIILNRTFERTPSGKIMKADLRKIAKKQWEMRSQGGNGKATREPRPNL